MPEPVQQVSQAEVLAQLKTRGFDEGFTTSPLQEFKARLTAITGLMRTGQRGPYLVVVYRFDNLEVILSREPYLAPIADVEITHSNREKSRMGYLGASIDEIINAGLPKDAPADQVKGQDFLINKTQHWAITPGHMVWNQQAKEERPVDCWEVIGVEGLTSAIPTQIVSKSASGTSAVQQAINLLDGKVLQQWNQTIFSDPLIKSDTTLINNILVGKFLPPLIAAGIVTVDGDGIHHVKM